MTEATWNPIAGCTPVSPGCLNCHAAKMSHRLDAMGQAKYRGLTVLHNGTRTFNGTISFDEAALQIPLRRKKPCTYFVNSMSDLFHEAVPFDFVDKVFAVMALCPQHTFQVLTKRPERMEEYTYQYATPQRWANVANDMGLTGKSVYDLDWNNALPNVWLGTSAEDQKCADARIPHLLKCPAAVRFLSCEPLLGPIDLKGKCFLGFNEFTGHGDIEHRGIDWVIVGGESGPKARPMHPDWVRSLRDQCTAAGVAFFFKQWGEWIGGEYDTRKGKFVSIPPHDVIFWTNPGHPPLHHFERKPGFDWWNISSARVGKKAAERLLDGREWNELPEVAHANA